MAEVSCCWVLANPKIGIFTLQLTYSCPPFATVYFVFFPTYFTHLFYLPRFEFAVLVWLNHLFLNVSPLQHCHAFDLFFPFVFQLCLSFSTVLIQFSCFQWHSWDFCDCSISGSISFFLTLLTFTSFILPNILLWRKCSLFQSLLPWAENSVQLNL